MAAKKGGRKYPLVIFTTMLGRWWTAVFALGVGMAGLAFALYGWQFEQWRWGTFAGLGFLFMLIGLLMFALRKSAYVQPFADHLRLATPFLRLNISYKRFRRTSSASMGSIFPPKSIARSLEEIVSPLAKMTAIVIELNALPMPQTSLRLFLSPLFFKDKSPHIIILVEDWMRFSAEMDSLRHGGEISAPQNQRDISILSKLPKK